MITQQELKMLFSYDPETGDFTVRVDFGRYKVDQKVGHISNKGRMSLSIKNKNYLANRLAWLYEHGPIPDDLQVDHIDGDKLNNRIANLRLASASENIQNIHEPTIRNKSGYRGVAFKAREKRFVAAITWGGQRKELGYFKTAEEARDAYLKAKKELHPFADPKARRAA